MLPFTSHADIENFIAALKTLINEKTLPHFRNKLTIENKEQNAFDPVTIADKECENALRSLILNTFPDHTIIGEEFATHHGTSPYSWIIDPIDGTRAFISGLPGWMSLIGLFYEKKPIFSFAYQPFIDELYLAYNNNAWRELKNIRQALPSNTSQCTLSDAIIMTTAPEIFTGKTHKQFSRIKDSAKLMRYGYDAYAYCMLASGHIDAVVETELKEVDILPLLALFNAQNITYSNWQNGADLSTGQIIAARNKELHAEIIKKIQLDH